MRIFFDGRNDRNAQESVLPLRLRNAQESEFAVRSKRAKRISRPS